MAVLDKDLAHGFINRPFGVEDDSVKVEEDGIEFHAEGVAWIWRKGQRCLVFYTRLDLRFDPLATEGDEDEEHCLDEEVDAHEDPDLDEGELEEGVVKGNADDAEEDEAGK